MNEFITEFMETKKTLEDRDDKSTKKVGYLYLRFQLQKYSLKRLVMTAGNGNLLPLQHAKI